MIQSLTIKNFQAHKRLTINLDPYITTIVGPSDAGKSAIIRALQWVTFNRPSGEAFITHGTSAVSVEIHLTEGVVKRAKGSENLYEVNSKKLVAMGSDVPTAVTTLLNLGPINFQRQHDSPFWFSETAGEVSRQLNQIVNLAIIDSMLANIASALRSANAEVDVVTKRLTAAKEERAQLKHARQMNEGLVKVEALNQDASQKAVGRARIATLLGEARNYSQTAERASTGRIRANLALVVGMAWQAAGLKRETLAKLVLSGRESQQAAKRRPPSLGPLEKKADEWSAAKAIIDKTQALVAEAETRSREIWAANKELETSRKQLKVLIGNTCPLCGSKIIPS